MTLANQIIDVNEEGYDALGNCYTMYAAPHVVDAGFMVNVPRLIRFPDGMIEAGNEAMFTQDGLRWVEKELLHDKNAPKPTKTVGSFIAKLN